MISGKARLAGVLGWPVGHSKSPRLHGHWLERYGVDGAYVPLPVRPEKFVGALRALADLGFAGCNVTVPHKEAALAACDEVSVTARAIGAVNTVVMQNGRLLGDNSDAFGFLENLRQGSDDWRPLAGPAVVVGAGGAARAVLYALLEAGVPDVRLVNRTLARAEELRDALDRDGRLTVADWSQREQLLEGAALLVNTTQLGMTGQEPLDLALDALPTDALVNDIVYSPLETPLLAAARERGNPVVDGLGMLLHQARLGFRQWFGVEPEVDAALRRAVLDA